MASGRWSGLVAVVMAAAACGDDADGSGAGGGCGGGAATGAAQGGGDAATTGSGGGEGGGATATTTGAGGEGTGGGDAAWTTLLSGDWELAAGEEITSAILTMTAERDIVVGAIRPIAPLGTHHTVLALNGFSPDDYIYASGVDTNELVFPAGVGLRIPAGTDVVLQLHLFNPTPGAITGTSGIEIVELDEGELEQEADIILPGPMDLEIPPLGEHSQSSTCVVNTPQTLFALFPHMHQLGSHFRTTVTVSGEEVVVHDAPYEFEHQPFLALEPVALEPGDAIETTCTWNNTTNQTVFWGESSEAEMCFSILYRWPAQEGGGFCP